MKRIQAYRIHSDTYGEVTIVSLDNGYYAALDENLIHSVTGSISRCLKHFGIKLPCESCGTKEHVGVSSTGEKLWDKFVCLSCSTKKEYNKRIYWSVLDHQRYEPNK